MRANAECGNRLLPARGRKLGHPNLPRPHPTTLQYGILYSSIPLVENKKRLAEEEEEAHAGGGGDDGDVSKRVGG